MWNRISFLKILRNMLVHGSIPKLKITINKDHIATLFYDKKERRYGLIYYESLEKYPGLQPFNLDLPKDEPVEIGKTYYSTELWYPFSARMPNKNRRDCLEELRKHNLTLNDHPLKILSRVGRESIANRWKLEPL
ncbi:MAG: hypothetical protein OXB86_02190 [Bdellovibrionales bacterium]|nr:hypothetical protein [Bdellovibrionales bacterium]